MSEYPTADKIAEIIQTVLQDHGPLPVERCKYVAELILDLFPEEKSPWMDFSTWETARLQEEEYLAERRRWWDEVSGEFANDDS